MTDKLDVEAIARRCEKSIRCLIPREGQGGVTDHTKVACNCETTALLAALAAKDEAIAREHELYLTAHRDNMKAAAMIAELKSRAAAAEKALAVKDEDIKGLRHSIEGLQMWARQTEKILTAEREAKEKSETALADLESVYRKECAAHTKTIERVVELVNENAELKAALSGRTISCSNCNALEKERDESRAMYVKDVSEAQKQIAALQAQLAQKDEALRAALDTVDVGCRLDHEGYCQNHNLEQDCWVPKARAALRQSVPASHEAGEGRP